MLDARLTVVIDIFRIEVGVAHVIIDDNAADENDRKGYAGAIGRNFNVCALGMILFSSLNFFKLIIAHR